jgi:hypothetical protein
MAPGVVAAAFGHGRDTSRRLQCISGAVAVTRCAERHEAAAGNHRARAWQGGTAGASGRALGAWRQGRVEVCHGVQDAPELGDEGLNQAGSGGDNTRLGGQRGGTLDGLEARVDDVDIASMRGAEEALEGGAARELGGFERRSWGENVADEGGVLVVTPLSGVREVVFQGTGAAVGEAPVVADHAAALVDEVRKGTHGGALGGKGRQGVARLAQACTWPFGGSGIVLGRAGSAGCAVLGQGPRGDGEQDQEGRWTQGVDERACGKFEAHSDGVSCAPLV